MQAKSKKTKWPRAVIPWRKRFYWRPQTRWLKRLRRTGLANMPRRRCNRAKMACSFRKRLADLRHPLPGQRCEGYAWIARTPPIRATDWRRSRYRERVCGDRRM